MSREIYLFFFPLHKVHLLRNKLAITLADLGNLAKNVPLIGNRIYLETYVYFNPSNNLTVFQTANILPFRLPELKI